MLLRNTVQREDKSKPIGFSPPHRQLQNVDAIVFLNEDHQTSHQPYPAGGDKEAWGGVILPQDTSNTLDLNAPGSYAYACALHPDETGSITVSNQIQIGASPRGGAAFGPNPLNITAGQCVSWLNSDAEAHQPSPPGGPANAWTNPIDPESPASNPYTFAVLGTQAYVCALHEGETGSILVGNMTIAGGPPATFAPPALVLTASGNQVAWINTDAISHQPEPDTGTPWLSAPIAAGAISPTVTLSAGTYPYHCVLHASETGSITIT